MTVLTITTAFDYSSSLLNDIEEFHFTAGATAAFAVAQFNGTSIRDDVLVTGSDGINAIVVNGGTVDASGWQFAAWSSIDTLTFNGTAGDDSIIGSSIKDIISGGDGRDTLIGGAGADVLVAGGGNDFIDCNAIADTSQYFDNIDGGAGTADALRLFGGTYDFRDASISGIEQLELNGGANALFTGQQIRSSGIAVITVDDFENHVEISGTDVDVTGVVFDSWTNGLDKLVLRGHATLSSTVIGGDLREYIAGGNGNDTFDGGGGSDRIQGDLGLDSNTGGAGADRFQYRFAGEFEAGEIIDGGSGKDTLELVYSDIYDLTETIITEVEVLEIKRKTTASIVTVLGNQLGGDGAVINTVIGNKPDLLLDVIGSNTDISGVTFESWDSDDRVRIIGGILGKNTLIGSSVNDSIFGGNNTDTIIGGTGDDTAIGGRGADSLQGDTGNDALSGGADNDTLTGGADDDALTGDAGLDKLSGGSGADQFIYNAVADSAAGAKRDVISDFQQGSDKIVLTAIDANGSLPGGAFDFIGTAGFSGTAGELRFFRDFARGYTLIEGDTDGVNGADFQIQLKGLFTLTALDFDL